MADWRRSWPQIRAALIAAHVASIVVLSVPGKGMLTNPRAWDTPNARAELAAWSDRLGRMGIATSPEALGADVLRIGTAVGTWRDRIAWPFSHYAQLTGARQGWQMFLRPQQHPAELHVDVLVDGQWQALVRPWDPESTWRARQRAHNRVRKLLGRFARTFYPSRYDSVARWFARHAARDFPAATDVRVRLWRYRSPSPAQRMAGTLPEGHYEHERTFEAQALR